MTQEDKELLIKDLCARLPYGVKVNCNDKVYNFTGIHSFNICVLSDDNENNAFTTAGLKYIKPYLFPMSSMTEEQRNEYHELLYNPKHGIDIDYFDWCHKNNLDCRGLISKGIALDATGLNIY